jgi:hypothetical protein
MISKLQQMLDAGIPVSPSGSNEDTGMYAFGASMTTEQLQQIADILNPPDYAELRRREYIKRGCTVDALTVLLWEQIIEGRPETATALQTERVKVKNKYPKAIR